jgi:hypothetical protein
MVVRKTRSQENKVAGDRSQVAGKTWRRKLGGGYLISES